MGDLLTTAIALRDDLLRRGELESDGVVTVNASAGCWMRFNAAIDASALRTDPDHIAAIRLARAALEGSLEALDAAVENVQGIWDDEHAEASNDLRAFMLREIDIAKARAGVARGTITHLDTLLQTKGDDRGEG